MGMLTGKEILLLDLYSFQRWPDVRAAFDRFGSYTPSWSAARRQAVADDGDTDWWNAISPAYRWMGRKVHIPSGRHWHSRHDCEDDRHPDYVGRHTVRDRCHIAVCEVNTGMMDDGWDDPRLYRRRVKWEC